MVPEKNLSSKMQRASGEVHLGFITKNSKTTLSDLYQSGCLKLMLPNNHSEVPDGVLLNTAGGLTGGDKIATKVNLGPTCKARVATQTAERIYRSTKGITKIKVDIDLGQESQLDWLSQETILFDGGSFNRDLNVNMHSSSSVLLVESLLLGRTAMDEQISIGFVRDKWRIYRDDKLLYADTLLIKDFERLKSAAAFGENHATASVLFIDPVAEEKVLHVKELLKQYAVYAGASGWNGMLFVRLLSKDAYEMRQCVINIVQYLRQRELPRVWMM